MCTPIHVFQMRSLYLAYFIGTNVHLLLIQIYCSEAQHRYHSKDWLFNDVFQL
jgi:hypothetical protein